MSTPEEAPASAGESKMQMEDVKGPQSLVAWYLEAPLSRWPILLFLCGVLLTLVFMVVAGISGSDDKEDANSAFVPAGLAGLIVCIYGAYHFRILMRLREQVNVYEQQNKEFRSQNAAMVKEISHLKDAQTALATQEERLNDVNQHNEQNLVRFKTIESNLESMGSANVAGMSNVLETLHALDARLKKNMIQQQRSLYLRVFDEMEFKDDEAGMTETEYAEFLKALPREHRKRLEDVTTFKELAGDDDKIEIEEFSQFLDKLAGEKGSK